MNRVLMGTMLLAAIAFGARDAAAWTDQSNPGSNQGGRGNSAARDACTLFTPEEIASAVGASVQRARPEDTQTGTQCRFQSSAGSVNIWTGPLSAKEFEEFRQRLAAQGKKPQNAPGIGDGAYFWDDRINVRVGNRGLNIWLGSGDAASSEKRRTAVLNLAKAGAEKLR